MFGSFTVKLTKITVKAYFPPELNLEELLITDGTGVLTISMYPIPYPPVPPGPPGPSPQPLPLASPPSPVFPTGTRYYLQVNTGTAVNVLRLGQLVTVSGVDDEKKPILLAMPLETVGAKIPALFSGPFFWLPLAQPTA